MAINKRVLLILALGSIVPIVVFAAVLLPKYGWRTALEALAAIAVVAFIVTWLRTNF
jgi:hypothetical protein